MCKCTVSQTVAGIRAVTDYVHGFLKPTHSVNDVLIKLIFSHLPGSQIRIHDSGYCSHKATATL